MTGWIFSLFCVVLATALVELLMVGEGKKSTRRYLHLLTALVILVMLAQPLLSIARGGEDFLQSKLPEITVETDYEAIFEQAIAHKSRAELEDGLYRLLESEFGIARTDATLSFSFDDTGALTRVRVTLSGKALLQNPSDMEESLRERFACDVEVR